MCLPRKAPSILCAGGAIRAVGAAATPGLPSYLPMKILKPGTDFDDFFLSLNNAPRRALLLDYDGTLAPFREERDQALPYPGVADILATLLEGGHTRVVLISGRAIEDLIPLLSFEPLPEIWGSHGWERRLPDGRHTFFPLPKQAKEGLERARNALPEQWTSRCEAKPAGLALHFRGMEPEAERRLAAEIARLWRPLAERHELELHAFDGGLELRPRGRSKGDAVASLLEELGAGTAVAYLGDDLTDEDGFRAIATRGLGILVRPELRETAATAWLRPPEELLDFLHRWARG